MKEIFIWRIMLFTTLLCVVDCGNASSASNTYRKDNLSFEYPASWKVAIDLPGAPWSDRLVNVSAKGDSRIVIELYKRAAVEAIPAHREIHSSLRRYASKFNKHDIASKLAFQSKPEQKTIQRQGRTGLLSTQMISVLNKKLKSIQEFYRIDFAQQTAFIVLDTKEGEYKGCVQGLLTMLKTLRINN